MNVARRAPRLTAQERLAPHITRRGRFRRIDPSQGRPLPALSHILATLGWVTLVLVSFRRARRM